MLAMLIMTHKFPSSEEGLLVQTEPFFERWKAVKELCNCRVLFPADKLLSHVVISYSDRL